VPPAARQEQRGDRAVTGLLLLLALTAILFLFWLQVDNTHSFLVIAFF
jgi:hypothetical protein